MAATVVGALVALVAVVTILKVLLSTEVGENNNTGRFHRRVLQAVPVQALKIVVVVWQILIQVCAKTMIPCSIQRVCRKSDDSGRADGRTGRCREDAVL